MENIANHEKEIAAIKDEVNQLKGIICQMQNQIILLNQNLDSTNKINTNKNVENVDSVKAAEVEKDISEVVNASANIPANIKFKCDMCNSRFKKKITLEKHKNTKHGKNNLSVKIGEGQFGFTFDVRPGKETEAEELRTEWREERKDDNTNEKNTTNGKVENSDNEKVNMPRKAKQVTWLMWRITFN